MCETININEYKCLKMEKKYFEFYTYIEDYFLPKHDVNDIIIRTYLAIRYLQDLSITLHRYMHTKDAKEHVKKVAKAEAGWLEEIVEVLNG